MNRDSALEPPFDPRWLDLLSERCSKGSQVVAPVEDIFLERRLEARLADEGCGPQMELCSSEGAAVRWHHRGRDHLHAATGTSPRALAELLSRHSDAGDLAVARPVPPAEMDAPRGWREWARELVLRAPQHRPQVLFFNRQVVVVRSDGWHMASAPPLVRVRLRGENPAALLAVWGHPSLGTWLAELLEAPPARPWTPSSASRQPVLFAKGTAGALMHELIGHLCESDLAASGLSPLSGLQGATITAASISVTDDPTRFDLPGAFDHDDEGVPAEAQHVVERGRLCGWLCDSRGAAALSRPAGRGRRAGWHQPPSARLSNLIVAAGTVNPSDLEADIKHGLMVTRIGGATVDPVSSRVVVHVERGWEIRGGRRRRPLTPFDLSGSVMEILAAVDADLGDDPTPDWRLGWCVKHGAPLPTGSVAPTMLLREMEVL